MKVGADLRSGAGFLANDGARRLIGDHGLGPSPALAKHAVDSLGPGDHRDDT